MAMATATMDITVRNNVATQVMDTGNVVPAALLKKLIALVWVTLMWPA